MTIINKLVCWSLRKQHSKSLWSIYGHTALYAVFICTSTAKWWLCVKADNSYLSYLKWQIRGSKVCQDIMHAITKLSGHLDSSEWFLVLDQSWWTNQARTKQTSNFVLLGILFQSSVSAVTSHVAHPGLETPRAEPSPHMWCVTWFKISEDINVVLWFPSWSTRTVTATPQILWNKKCHPLFFHPP